MLTWGNVELRPNPLDVINIEEGFFPLFDVGGAPFAESLIVMLLPDNKEEVAQRTPSEPEEIAQLFHGGRAVTFVFVKDE